ncbi:hypothetical protein BS78_03G061600 [Paspalum vaginatum]|nr:hypothetical protein BS78_03G061600 [Paspalum vaginatum]
MATRTTTLKMKLLIDAKARRVLFAEAGKDVVDFLFSLLALPVATIVKMLGKWSMFGSFGNLYSSVEKLDYDYVIPGVEKNAVLLPQVVPSAASTSRSSLLLLGPSSGQPKSFFRCRLCDGQKWHDVPKMLQQDECGTQVCSASDRRLGAGCAEGLLHGSSQRVRSGGGDVHGEGQPHSDAHVCHLQHRIAQHTQGHRLRCAPGGDRAPWLHRGPGDPQGVAPVHNRPHGRFPGQQASSRWCLKFEGHRPVHVLLINYINLVRLLCGS